MLKRDELANPNSCLNRAADDEPIFVLKATDEVAPTAIRAWAKEYFASKSSPISVKQIDKYREALMIADQMEEWRSCDRNSNNK